MSSELELRHASMITRVAQLEALLVDRRSALAAALEAEKELAQSLAAARLAVDAEQRRERECRLRYVQTEKRAYEHVKGGVEVRPRR